MATNGLTYYDFAEEDRLYWEASYNSGLRSSAMAYLAQSICERYLKHLITQFSVPETSADYYKYTDVLRAHSLRKITRFISETLNIDVASETFNSILAADGFYFTARYPGDDSYLASASDVEACRKAIIDCKEYVDRVISEQLTIAEEDAEISCDNDNSIAIKAPGM